MEQKFDPLHKWLGISPKDQPPDHYRLLGVDRFESDPQVIELAADRQMAHVRTFQSGPHSESQSQQLLNALSAAKICLLKPDKKDEYDKALYAKTEAAKPKPQPRMPAPATPASATSLQSNYGIAPQSAVPFPAPLPLSIPSVVPQPQFLSSARPRPVVHRSFPWGIAAAVVVMLMTIVGVVGVMISRRLDEVGKQREIAEKNATQPAYQSPAPSVAQPAAEQLQQPTEPLVARQPANLMGNQPPGNFNHPPRVEPNNRGSNALDKVPPANPEAMPVAPGIEWFEQPAASRPPRPELRPAPRPEPEPVRVVSPLQDLPGRVRLPVQDGVPASPDPVPIARLEIPAGKDLKLKLLGAVPQLKKSDPARRYELTKRPDMAPTWRVAIATMAELKAGGEPTEEVPPVPLAEFSAKEDQLWFKWMPDVEPGAAGDLNNCMLEFRLDEHLHRMGLRELETAPALVLDLDDDTMQVPLQGKFFPPLDWLKLELLEANGLSVPVSFVPATQVGTRLEPLRVVLRQGSPLVEIRFRVVADKKSAKIMISPVVADADGKNPMAFSTGRINTMFRGVTKELTSSKSQLAALQAKHQAIQNEMSAVNNSSGNAGDKAAALNALEGDLINTQNSGNSLIRKIPILEQRLSVLPSLADLGNQVHKKAIFKFALYFDCQGQRIDLIRVE